jgi:hypothetical protein
VTRLDLKIAAIGRDDRHRVARRGQDLLQHLPGIGFDRNQTGRHVAHRVGAGGARGSRPVAARIRALASLSRIVIAGHVVQPWALAASRISWCETIVSLPVIDRLVCPVRAASARG